MASIISAGTTSGTSLNLSGDTSGVLQLASNGSTTAVTIDTNQRAAFVAGTAALPAITTTGDTNTGIFFPAADTIAFTEGGAEAMRIDSSGNVGIGTSSPATKTEISGTAAASNLALRITNTATDGYSTLQMGDGNAGIYRNGSAQSAYAGASSLNLITVGAHNIGFSTQNTLRAIIDSSGNLLVGTTNSSITAGEGFKAIYNAGSNPYVAAVMASSSNSQTNYHLYSTGAGAYRFYVGLAGTVYATSTTITGISDQRLKENIVDLNDGLDAVMALKPRKFDWKDGKGKGIKGDRGFIAQEFETVFPDMIEEWKDPAPEGEEPYKAVNANLIPTLVKAIQELNAKVDAQAVRIAELEGVK